MSKHSLRVIDGNQYVEHPIDCQSYDDEECNFSLAALNHTKINPLNLDDGHYSIKIVTDNGTLFLDLSEYVVQYI